MEDVDARSSAGLTPLMIACKDLDDDRVEELLTDGADPNLKCEKTLNTPLHFVCDQRYRDPTNEEVSLAGIRITQALLKHGAVCLKNLDGFSPLDLAALCGSKDLVEYFEYVHMLSRTFHDLDFVRAYELLGVSHTVFQNPDLVGLHEYLLKARKNFDHAHLLRLVQEGLKCESSDTTDHSDMAEFKNCFTLEEGHGRPPRNAETYAEGWITALKILPPKMLDSMLWEDFALFAFQSFTEDQDYEVYGHENGFRMFTYLIKLEMKGSLRIGTVLGHLCETWDNEYPSASIISHTLSLMKMYAERLHEIDCDSLRNRVSNILNNVGNILVNLVFCNQPFHVNLAPFVQAIVQIMNKCSRAADMHLSEEPWKLSVTYIILRLMCVKASRFLISFMARTFQQRLLYALNILLPHDPYIHFTTGSSEDPLTIVPVLHLLMRQSALAVHGQSAGFLTRLARMLIRYGCSIYDLDLQGRTAKEVFVTTCLTLGVDSSDPQVEELQNMLTSGPVSLEETAIRVILQRKIPYKGRLPRSISVNIEGGMGLNLSDVDPMDTFRD